MSERPPRLGDVIDDYCPRCRLLLNHDVASLTGESVAKVTCRTCHNTHDYRNAQVPTRRKPDKRSKPDVRSLMDQVLAGLPVPPEPAAAPPPPPPAAARKRRDLWAEVERIRQQRREPDDK